MTTQPLEIPENIQNHHDTTQCAVLGIGNPILADEGIGVHVVEHLRKKYSFSPEIALIDGGCGGLNLYFILERFASVIIIDALPPGTAAPGSSRVIKNLLLGTFTDTCSAHFVGIKDVLLLLKSLATPPPDLILIGIVPDSINYSFKLSSVIEQSLLQVEKAVLQQLKSRNIEVHAR